MPASVQHAARAGSDKSNVAHAGRALQKHYALPDRQNKQWRGQEMEYLVYFLTVSQFKSVLTLINKLVSDIDNKYHIDLSSF